MSQKVSHKENTKSHIKVEKSEKGVEETPPQTFTSRVTIFGSNRFFSGRNQNRGDGWGDPLGNGSTGDGPRPLCFWGRNLVLYWTRVTSKMVRDVKDGNSLIEINLFTFSVPRISPPSGPESPHRKLSSYPRPTGNPFLSLSPTSRGTCLHPRTFTEVTSFQTRRWVFPFPR